MRDEAEQKEAGEAGGLDARRCRDAEGVTYETFDIAVDGGSLRVGRWGGGDDVVLALHGITVNHLAWQPLAEHVAGGVTIVAPDLRGRGRSSAIAGPFGMRAHARDAVAILDHLGIDRAILLGQSMGAYVAVVAAAEHPQRFERAVLADGGLPLPLPLDIDIDATLTTLLGPTMERLKTTFASRAAVEAFWRAHPSLQPWQDGFWPLIEYDLAGEEPELRSSVNADAVREDAADTLSPTVPAALRALTIPVVLLRAERGVLNEETPLVPDALAAAWPQVADRGVVPGTNHFTLFTLPHALDAIAGELRTRVPA